MRKTNAPRENRQYTKYLTISDLYQKSLYKREHTSPMKKRRERYSISRRIGGWINPFLRKENERLNGPKVAVSNHF